MAKDEEFNVAELAALVSQVNLLLGKDRDLDCLPIKPPHKLFRAQRNGVLFCKLLNRIKRGTVSPSEIHFKVKNIQQALENQRLVIEGAKKLGCDMEDICPEDLWSGKDYLVLGMLWQITKISLLCRVNVEEHPQLAILRRSEEEWTSFSQLPPETILQRWVNYHLGHSDYRLPEMTDFSASLKDSVIYTHLLHQLAPHRCDLRPLDEQDLFVRAQRVLKVTEGVSCRKYLTPHELVKGNPRLNLAFVTNLFHTMPGLEFSVTEMDKVRLTEELKTALNRCHYAEEEKRILIDVGGEMTEELKGARKTLENSLIELETSLSEVEALKRKIEKLEEENKRFTQTEEEIRNLRAQTLRLNAEVHNLRLTNSDCQATIANQEITISSLRREKEIIQDETKDHKNEVDNSLATALHKHTTLILQKEAITHERDLLKRKHDKCETEVNKLHAQVNRHQRHSEQLRHLYTSFESDEELAATLYGRLDLHSLENAHDKTKCKTFSQVGGSSLDVSEPQQFLMKDNFLFVFDINKTEEPNVVLRMDQAIIQRTQDSVLTLRFPQKEACYYIKVNAKYQLKELKRDLESAADWWTERHRSSPSTHFRDVVRTNFLNKTKVDLGSSALVAADV